MSGPRARISDLFWRIPDRFAIGVLDAVGATTIAERHARLRIGDDVLSIPIPPTEEALRTRQIRMRRVTGRDLVVRTIGDGGWRSFEPPLPDVVLSVLRQWPGVMFDVGANTGLYSLIAVAADRDVEVHAFEPVPEIVDIAADNLSLNWPASKRITLHSSAVGDQGGRMQLHFPPAQTDGTIETSASLEATFKDAHESVIDVDVVTLDAAWADAGRPETSLVKIDVEGAEHRVLAGASELIAACRPILAVEVLERAETAPLEELCRSSRYVAVTLSPYEAVVNPPRIEEVDIAPNQLLVPWERLDTLVERLGERRDFVVTLLD